MTSSEIRSKFIRYFVERGHAEVPSSPLIPESDPTLLFTNAGMVQFKSVFLGEEQRPYKRAASSQKCMRAGGKHNDLDNVGQTARHHTFFEMLGNFSFGDYFKQNAIAYAWELLTHVFKLSPERLWVTVYQEDDEAAELWKKHVPADRIVRLGEKDNFWSMGETGPCGPCSEILIDQGERVHADCPGIGRCDCDRYLEIWNLVFMQYNRDAQGKLTPLPKPSIDTGMGLERITAVCQGVLSNYETDLFQPIFKTIGARAGKSEEEVQGMMAGRVIADHLRAITFLINDGVIPSNEGRGYVLRRILRRAARFGKQLGFHDPFLHTMTGVVIDTMRGPYPDLEQHRRQIEQAVLLEEERFIHTLNQGVQILEEMIAKVKGRGEKILPGEALFTLYDTYGFPLDLAAEIGREAGLGIDEGGFRAAMEVQRERARKSWVGAGEADRAEPVYRGLLEEFGKSRFTGYEHLEEEITLQAILKEGERVASAKGGDTVDLIFSASPFYAEGGGQVGDRGTLSSATALVEISNTVKPLPDLHLHRAKVIQGTITSGERLHAIVDAEGRKNSARNHTGTHILHAVLREVLGDHVKQAGSLVAPDRLRFDFYHFTPLTEKEIDRIEARVNERIREDAQVQTNVMEIKEAISTGAMALFGEKYGEQVRVVQMADFSRELCGGTHCHDTGEIGLFKIIKESSVAAGIRRIEALTGPAAYQYIKGQERLLRDLSSVLRSRPEEVVQRVERLNAQLQEKDREMEKLKSRAASPAGDPLGAVRKIGSLSLSAQKIAPADIKEIRAQADRLRDRLKSGVIIVGAPDPKGEKVSIVVMVTPDWTSHISAAAVVKELAGLIDGTGGGKPEMAQAGGKRIDKLDAAIEQSAEIIKKMLES
ncbi:MAG: alanine--tRNA ligase [Nitrospirae bacterium]|nr:alanine--tRNA ligase [Candidatus Manganitrophaceae bacterium]